MPLTSVTARILPLFGISRLGYLAEFDKFLLRYRLGARDRLKDSWTILRNL